MTETGIPCWRCHTRSGIDCPGRGPNESTLCDPCLQVQDLELRADQAGHYLQLMNNDEIDRPTFDRFMRELLED